MTMNFEQARQNMVESQVRPWAVLDQDVLAVLGKVPRELFVPDAYRQLAFADLNLPLGHDQVMMKPVIEGRLLQALGLQATDSVLEIGTGSGFLSACLASLVPAGRVHSIDIQAEFVERARTKLAAVGIDNVDLEVADAVLQFKPAVSYDVIVVTGAVAELPQHFLHWLKPNGRLFAVRGQSPAQKAVLLTRSHSEHFRETELFETDIPYLSHAEPSHQFVF